MKQTTDLASHLLELAENLKFLATKSPTNGYSPDWPLLNHHFCLIQLAWGYIGNGQEEVATETLGRIEW